MLGLQQRRAGGRPRGRVHRHRSRRLPFVWDQGRQHRRMLGQQPLRAVVRPRRRLHRHHSRQLPFVRDQGRQHRRMLGRQLGWAGGSPRRRLHRHHSRLLLFVRDQSRQHHRMLGQQRIGAGGRPRRRLLGELSPRASAPARFTSPDRLAVHRRPGTASRRERGAGTVGVSARASRPERARSRGRRWPKP